MFFCLFVVLLKGNALARAAAAAAARAAAAILTIKVSNADLKKIYPQHTQQKGNALARAAVESLKGESYA